MSSYLKIAFIPLFLLCFAFVAKARGKNEETGKKNQNHKGYITKRLLVLNAYHEGFHWTDRIMDGVHSVFDTQNDVELFVNYMDTKRCSDSTHYQQLKFLYANKYKNVSFDAVLCSDDHALDFILKYQSELFPNIPVVFCGVNDYTPVRIAGRKNITGVQEAYNVESTIKLILRLHPNTEHIAVISEQTLSGQTFTARTKRVEHLFEDKVEFHFYTNHWPYEIKQALDKLPANTVVLWTAYIRTPDGAPLSASEGVRLIDEATDKPVYCLWDVVGLGVVGGKVIAPVQHGIRAATIVSEILDGKPISMFPVLPPQLTYKFDYVQLEKFNIPTSSLPVNSIIINEPHSVWKEFLHVIFVVLSIIVFLLIIVFILLNNIRKRKLAEAKLRESNGELVLLSKVLQDANANLEEAKERAEENDRLKTIFLDNLSHEIRTPMNGIMGFANLLKTSNLPLDKHAEYLDIIEHSGKRMLSLINDLVFISKIEAGQLELAESKVELQEILDECIQNHLPNAEEKQLKLFVENELPKGVGHVWADHMKLELVLNHLFDNAVKFTDKGYIILGIKQQEADLIFWVQDTGIGIEKAMHDIIFDRFHQLDDKPLPDQGIGLGLAIVKAFVELMKGEIWLKSELGKGSTFSFSIPAKFQQSEHA